ncbi:replication protein, partial [Klebsiella pneumoniae]|nr:replication protein [Klebsiella pneumoniae]
SCPNRIPVISKLALVLDIYSSLSLIWRYSYCPVFQGATSISQSALAEELNMSKSNVCKCWNKLINKGILVKEGKHTMINANLFLKGQYRTLNATRKEYVKKSLRTTSEGIEDVFVTVYKDTVLTNNVEKTIDKEDDKPLLSTPDEDIDWNSVSEDDIFVDYPEYVDQEERM